MCITMAACGNISSTSTSRMDRKLWHLLNGFGFRFGSQFSVLSSQLCLFLSFFIRLGLFHFTTAQEKGRLLSCIILMPVPRPSPPTTAIT